MDTYDLMVIGAGTHGTGVAADAAGRGLRVILVDEQDLGEASASVSSRLLVGGLRYLEQWHIGLVRQSLAERHVLMHRAPFLVDVRPFIQVVHPRLMKRWRARLLLHAYDLLGARRLGHHQLLDLPAHPYGAPIRPEFTQGLMYYDCTGDEVRLAVLNARQAAAMKASVAAQTRILRLRRANRAWEAELEDAGSGARRTVSATGLVNTAGPWVEELLNQAGVSTRCRSRLVKISHMIVPALYEGNQVYVLTGDDGHRICVNPIGDGLHLVGAAENDFGGHADPHTPSPSEIAWLCQTVSAHFRQPIREQDIVSCYSGLRPVYDDPTRPGSRVARHFLLDLDCPDCHSPLLRVYGGRVTNYRRMAECALEILKPWLPDFSGRWTRHVPLPGGAVPAGGMDSLRAHLQGSHPELAPALLDRMLRCYGSELPAILAHGEDLPGDPAVAQNLRDHGLHPAEVHHLRTHEWAGTAQQALRRIGLTHVADASLLAQLDAALASHPP